MKEVEDFATGDYAVALQKGSELDPARRRAVAERYAHYTGLPVAYVLRADLRITGERGSECELQVDQGHGHGPPRHPLLRPRPRSSLSKEASYGLPAVLGASSSCPVCQRLQRLRPQDPGLWRGQGLQPSETIFRFWDNNHTPPGRGLAARRAPCSAPRPARPSANAMKQNPSLKVMLLGGYYDLATPLLPQGLVRDAPPRRCPDSLQPNISYHYCESLATWFTPRSRSLEAMHDERGALHLQEQHGPAQVRPTKSPLIPRSPGRDRGPRRSRSAIHAGGPGSACAWPEDD